MSSSSRFSGGTSTDETSGRFSAASTAGGGVRADDDRPPLVEGLPERAVVELVEDQRPVCVELAVDRDLRDRPAGRAEPALSQTSTVSPGSITSSSTSVSFASSSGLPVRSGNVP